jgi:hypothetical protein
MSKRSQTPSYRRHQTEGLEFEISMPRLDDNTREYLHDAERGVRASTSRAWDSFSNFALRDNVLEVAVGLMYSLTQTTRAELQLMQ